MGLTYFLESNIVFSISILLRITSSFSLRFLEKNVDVSYMICYMIYYMVYDMIYDMIYDMMYDMIFEFVVFYSGHIPRYYFFQCCWTWRI